MKVGTDGVLLGAWASVGADDRSILDIGTGTGLIALMMAQRAPAARVTGVDVEPVTQARENAADSLWSDRISFEQVAIQEFAPGIHFDLILSNPPFFVDSLIPPDPGRAAARHTVRLSFEELRDAVVGLLAPGGRFATILPTAQADHFIAICCPQLMLTRRTDVRTVPERPPKRTLMEFTAVVSVAREKGDSCNASSGEPFTTDRCTVYDCPHSAEEQDAVRLHDFPVPLRSELIVGTGQHEQYTDEYRVLTRDFYLKF